jgi:shikimate kinase
MADLLRGLNVCLIGMMGTGKTTVGKILARQLNYRFFDTDVLIERVAGKTIPEIFVGEGEEKFRDWESQVLMELAACTRSIIATGGGIVLRQINWSYLHHSLVIWLDAPVELIAQRLLGDETRPLLQETDPISRLKYLLEQRRSLYAQADLHIVIDVGQTPEAIAQKIITQIPSALK